MTDPIRCQLNANQATPTFDCQPVELTGAAAAATNQCYAEPNQSLVDGEEALSSPPARPEAVVQLVRTVQGQVVIPPAEVSATELLTERGVECSGEGVGVGLLMAAQSRGLLAAAGAFKAGWDVGKCLGRAYADERAERTQAAAEQYCVEDGGTPLGWKGDTLSCKYEAIQ